MAKAKIYLYKEGNECESITGGWIGSKALTNYGGTGTGSKEFDKIIVTGGSSATYGFYTNNQFSNLSKAYIDYSSNGKSFGGFGINNNKMPFSSSSFLKVIDVATTDSITPRQVIELDLNYVSSLYHFCITAGGFSPLFVYNVYFNTSENVLTIHSQTNDNIIFSANDLGLVTISKIDVLVNGIVSKTYTDEYSKLSYTVDKSLCYIGNNNIEIRVTYSQGDDITETVSEYLTYKYDVSQLPQETPLLDTVERVKLLTNSKQNEKTMLSSILTSKNVEVSEEDKMSDLIGKVDLLGEYDDPILYLYKDGDNLKNISKVAKNENGNGVISVSFDNECIKIINNENSSSGATSNNALSIGINSKIDISKYTKIKCEFTSIVNNYNTGKTSIILLSSSNYTYNTWQEDYVGVFSKYKKQLGNETKAIVECDITNINELSYISVNVVGNTSLRSASVSIHKIWLEK